MTIQYFLPQRLISWCTRKLVHIKAFWFKNAFINLFVKFYPINWDECIKNSPDDYSSFNEFFTRELKADARPIENAPLISPADGKIAACGTLDDTQFIHAKGHHFSLESLIADPELASTFKNGSFATIYLSPSNYHRVHMPIDGKLVRAIHVPGKLYSVSLKTAESIPTLFAENERYISVFETRYGKIIIILVGAINVSSIETVWNKNITPPYARVIEYTDYTDQQIFLKKGEELGRFNMGSTVIVITEPSNDIQLNSFTEKDVIKMGQSLYKDCQDTLNTI